MCNIIDFELLFKCRYYFEKVFLENKSHVVFKTASIDSTFSFCQENLHKLVGLERDLVGIEDLVHPNRVC